MYDRILVPVDGSPTSDRGLAEAMTLASKFGSSLRLVYVVDSGPLSAAAGALSSNINELLSLVAEGGEKILAEAKQVAQSRGVNAETALHHSFGDRVCDAIVKEANDWKADLIVIGTHGRRGAGRLLLGSDAEQVLRLAPVPVLLVRDGGTR
jgi:nucleotide-binding universal stress UspA family protein